MTKRCFTFVILIYTIVIIYECIWNLSPSSVYLLSWTHNWDIRIFGHLTNFSFVSHGNHNMFSFIFFWNWSGCPLSANKEEIIFYFVEKIKIRILLWILSSKADIYHSFFNFLKSKKKRHILIITLFFQNKIQNFPEYFEINWYIILIEKNHSYFNRFQHVCSNFTSNCLLNITAIWQMLRVLIENTLSA